MADNILEKTRQAFVGIIMAANVGTPNIYNERNSAEKVAPDVTCGASNAQEDPLGTGNYWVDSEISIRIPAAVDVGGTDPKPAGDTICSNVLGILEVDDASLIAALSTQVADYVVMGFATAKSIEESVDGDCWVLTWKRRLYCAGSDF